MAETIGTMEDLHASAAAVTGLDDFGDDGYHEALSVLLESLAVDAFLTPHGVEQLRSDLRRALVARLHAEVSWQAHPGHADVAVERPIFVTGLPRSGTTALHRLLAADPAHQGPQLWLTEVPQPRPPRATWPEIPAYRQVHDRCEQMNAAVPEFAGIHYSAADVVEECWRLLQQDMLAAQFFALAYVPTYVDWLLRQDWTATYARHRRLLQLIGLPDAGKRWVLKDPSHIFTLDALLTVYPDALVIQTHRAPSAAVASVCSLSRTVSAGMSTVFTPELIGTSQVDLLSRGLARFAETRARHDPRRFYDVAYDDLAADPMGTVEAVYQHFGMTMTEQARTAIFLQDKRSRTGPGKPDHRYALADFGLRPEQVDERLVGLSG